jgi:hypothetical protein
MTASVDHWVGLWFFVIVPLSFGHPQQTPPPNPGKAAQVHLPRATQSSGPSSTQSIFQRDLALTFQPTVLPTANADCSLLSSIFRSCNSESPGFYTMDPYQQEQCFCASSSYWNPTTFLDAASNCALFVSTEAPSIYSQISIFSSLDYDYCALIFRTIWPYSTSENVASTTSGFGATGTPTITPLPVPIGNIQSKI